ncbi:adenylyltransferase/cytidyltransferase family protein [Pontibacter beigongshangensis]|uniref:adenylyltransferase/cytidyltransferase family protein n=1 Tax=Pontibacter beigongshangensis TaxID=2574733 RepID=UPI00164F35C6|nr:adenylyltransferase/cytidyltransferase family protein [Pontibacter beigongshangensis]
METKKKVMVTGCFDLLHSGHVAFLKEAARFGDLHVCIGNDENVHQLKGRYPVNSQDERRYMIEALGCTTHCHVNKGYGIIDFMKELEEIQPHIFIVNEDGATPAKAEICRQRNIEYKVLQRIPHENLPARSTTSLRTECIIPFRIDVAGGWLDQPSVSAYHPGPVLTISIEPTLEFNNRSGMASSTRHKAIELWRTAIPAGDNEKLAKILFTYENPPGTKEVAGSQDALGIVLPGLNRLYYNNNYWPDSIESIHDEDILDWLESHLYLVTLGPRTSDYAVVDNTNISQAGAKALADAAENCWEAIKRKDASAFGENFRKSFEAQVHMFPNMVDETILNQIALYKDIALGWKLSGAGGGGYITLVSEKPIENAIRIKIRRRDSN